MRSCGRHRLHQSSHGTQCTTCGKAKHGVCAPLTPGTRTRYVVSGSGGHPYLLRMALIYHRRAPSYSAVLLYSLPGINRSPLDSVLNLRHHGNHDKYHDTPGVLSKATTAVRRTIITLERPERRGQRSNSHFNQEARDLPLLHAPRTITHVGDEPIIHDLSRALSKNER